MQRRSWIILFVAVALYIAGAAVALAADGTKQVGLVIAFPDGSKYSDVLTVPVTATTYDVLQQAKIELIGTNGQFGLAVCSINKTGCPASNCFCDAKHFWAFYHLDSAKNQWVASSEGVGAAVPANGAVEGFIWSELDAKFNPTMQPPVMTLAQIQSQAGKVAAQPAAGQPARLPTTGRPDAIPWVLALAVALVGAGWFLGRGGRSAGGRA